MASEGVAVALSPQPGFVRGATVEVIFGAVGNTKTTVTRKPAAAAAGRNKNTTSNTTTNTTNPSPATTTSSSTEVSVPCRVCKEGTWKHFWVCFWRDKIYAGVGSLPGQKCLAILEANKDTTMGGGDDSNNDADSKSINQVGMEDAEEKPEADTAAGNATNVTPSSELLYVGLGNAAQQRRPVKVRNLYVTTVPTFVAQQLESTTEATTMEVLLEQQEDIDDEALKEFQEQCRKAKLRAEKFGIEYKEPTLASVVPWSQARKLRANPQKGFITGIDVTDAEELSKQEARKARFGELSKKREMEDSDDNIKKEDTSEMANASTEESLPVTQAWDNEELVRFQRSDPPPSLWKIPPDTDAEEEDEFSMETEKPTLIPEKIHVFSIDWSAFKQIRSEDLMVRHSLWREIEFFFSVYLNFSITRLPCATRHTLIFTGHLMWSGLVTSDVIFSSKINFQLSELCNQWQTSCLLLHRLG